MAIINYGGALHFSRLALELDEFPGLLRKHFKDDADTQEIEIFAVDTHASDFEYGLTKNFIHKVCKWGGYAGVGARVTDEKHNEKEDICSAMRGAFADAQGGDAGAGLARLLSLKHLGVSFASKHLKFLAPDRAVVLDSIISSRLGFQLTVEGYREFLDECKVLLNAVREAEIDYPGWGVDGWRISDIEMAIFAKVNP